MPELDPQFAALPRERLASAALDRALTLGAQHADVRVERIRHRSVRMHDANLEGVHDGEDLGLAVRVVHGGAWGFAAGVELTVDEAVRLAGEAVEVARVAAPLTAEPIVLAAESTHRGTWISAYDVDPFDASAPDTLARLRGWSRGLLGAGPVEHVDADLLAVREATFYADLAGTAVTQQRVRVHPQVTVTGTDPASGRFDSMRTVAPPVGRGLEYLTGSGWDWDAELAALPGWLADKLAAPSVPAGTYDLVIDPSNLWLTIHESIGHATELDRALGYEAAYAGTSFATPDGLGTLQYGSTVMTVTGDRQAEHGLATVGWDSEGVAAQTWDIIRDGVLVGYQLDRRIAARVGRDRSNGCAFADSPGHVPIQRMANVSLQPDPAGPDTAGLISRVERGIYVVGDKSWSIDMQRYNFQFTGQRFFAIREGRLDGMVRDVAYQATTTDFWRSMEAVGGPQTYVLGGAFNCGKGQPGQVAPVSHGCPAALFRGVRVLNTVQEGGR